VTKVPNAVSYVWGTPVTLTAHDSLGYHFSDWSGDTTVVLQDTLTVHMRANKAITATFNTAYYTVAVTAVNGTVTRDPNWSSYPYGSTVDLTAGPAPGYSFTGWTGDTTVSYLSNPLALPMYKNRNITANFAELEVPPDSFVLVVSATNGTVAQLPLPTGGKYDYGVAVKLTATGSTGYHSTGYTGDVTASTDTVTVMMTDDKDVTATFSINTYTLTYTAGAHGSMTGSGSQTVDHGEDGSLVTAVADTLYHFVAWSDGVTTAARTDLNVTANVTATATFAADTPAIEVPPAAPWLRITECL